MNDCNKIKFDKLLNNIRLKLSFNLKDAKAFINDILNNEKIIIDFNISFFKEVDLNQVYRN